MAISLVSCSIPRTAAYRAFYSHLQEPIPSVPPVYTSSNFLIFYVEARHLDYTDNVSFFKTVAKHPSDGSKNHDVGHAWIYLQGMLDGKPVFLEGGHSGERGVHQAKYFDGIMNYIDFGYANPSESQFACPRREPNPVKYLWDIQHDGYFERGSGRHRPTFAAKVDLTSEQFRLILSFIQNYDYQHYALTGNQCSSFVKQVAGLAGLDLDCEVTIPICSTIYFNGEKIRFWEDPYYSQLTIATPDLLERSLMQAVREGKAQRIYRTVY